jgi:drug/metabolite transporter (DMT)-like permease
MSERRHNLLLSVSLLFAIFLWGGTNAGTKYVVTAWPPVWTGSSRFCCAGLLLLGILRWTNWFGVAKPLTPDLRRALWWRGGFGLAIYIVVFNSSLQFTSASHVALYLGAAPVWALFWEGTAGRSWRTVQKYGAAVLALMGVFVLFSPSLRFGQGDWRGELLGLLASVLWTNYGRQCRALGAHLSGVETSAHTMWRAGVLLLPLAAVELGKRGLVLRPGLLGVHAYCILAGGVIAFAIWSNALRHWPTSQVLLFNNLIPLSTMLWAHFCLGEAMTPTFWLAMVLVVAGVILGQTDWQKVLEPRVVPPD